MSNTTIPVNTILNADCIAGMKSMPDLSADMTLTDIPYGEIRTVSSLRRDANPKHVATRMRNQDKETAGEIMFDLDEFLEQVCRVTRGGIYIFCGINQLTYIHQYFKYQKHKDFMVRQCAWKKTNPSTMNGQHQWLSSMENCVFAKRRQAKFNYCCKSAVWEFPTGRSKYHPTEKPLKLFKYLIEASSDVGDLVFDPCIGSGTTAVAAFELGRKYFGYELDKEYYDGCMKRLYGVRGEICD